MCFKCGQAWHPGVSCGKDQDSLFKEWASHRKIQRCPKCKIRIEKDEGCNHMTCSHCHYQWCWICGRKYTSGHYDGMFFGCAALQFTSSDWSLGKIALYHLVMFLISPLIAYYSAALLSAKIFCSWARSCYNCVCLAVVAGLLLIIICTLLVGTVMIIPMIIYRFTNLIYSAIRACER